LPRSWARPSRQHSPPQKKLKSLPAAPVAVSEPVNADALAPEETSGATVTAPPPPIKGPSSRTLRRQACATRAYNQLATALDRLCPGSKYSEQAVLSVTQMLDHLLDKLFSKADEIRRARGNLILAATDLETAVKLLLPEGLARSLVESASRKIAAQHGTTESDMLASVQAARKLIMTSE